MGGLLTRLLVSESNYDTLHKVIGEDVLNELRTALNDEKEKYVKERIIFKPFPSVRRVVFIAAPHKGARMATTWYGRLGAKLIRMPVKLVKQNQKLIYLLLGLGQKEYAKELEEFNGIFNLAPGGMMLNLLNSLALPEVPYHSIIGNRKDTLPGGSDGVVEYASSHLDGAASEVIIKNGHSVQQNPLAIQEIRRILLEHLKHYPEPDGNGARRTFVLPAWNDGE